MFIDTHTHLYSEKFAADREEMMERARARGVSLALLPAIDRANHAAMLRLEAQFPRFCHAMIGLHPVSVGEDYEEELAVVERYLEQRKWIAIGEIGMDLYWDKTYRKQQEDAFLRQCAWAIRKGLPISIHAREATDELLELIAGVDDERLRGVFHCFTGDLVQAQRAIDLGFYLGIGGVATFKKGGLENVLRGVPRERVVLETDAPYLAPAPYRGKRNESGYLPLVADKIAGWWGVTAEEVGSITTQNARQLFDLDSFADQVAS